MGCSSSTPIHPSIYNETVRKREPGIKPEKRPIKEENPNQLCGDYTQYQLAKHNRDKHRKQRQIELFIAADEMTGKILEQREMLSLGTRSRATSRNTSRGTSPTGGKRNSSRSVQITIPVEAPMTPVVEDRRSHRGSTRSEEPDMTHEEAEVVTESSASTHSPRKKHRKHKTSKSKSDSIKRKSNKDKQVTRASDGVDSGLEDEIDDAVDHEHNKENELTETVPEPNGDVNHNHSNAGDNVIDEVSVKQNGVKQNAHSDDSSRSKSKHREGRSRSKDKKGTSRNRSKSKDNDVTNNNVDADVTGKDINSEQVIERHHASSNDGEAKTTMHSSSKDSGFNVAEGAVVTAEVEQTQTSTNGSDTHGL